ncbi:MAG: maleylpyruvate isomerase N-terminal domain-containing protein [Nocardioides sp.]|uniref:maleylpyruvate isomerase N-terminal domain-containing protein n=1 Tax=Nocardioides sp. TaxID=35761 RepID=UPI0039E6CF12
MGLLQDASTEFLRAVEELPAGRGADDPCERPTPSEVSVRELVEHVVAGNRFAARLLAGVSRDEARAVLSGDQLGADAGSAVRSSCAAQAAAFAAAGPAFAVPHPNGEIPASDFLLLRVIDLVVHAWDLRRGAGLDERLSPAVVDALWDEVEPRLAWLLAFGAYGEGPSGSLPPTAPRQMRLLDALGRRP